MVKVLERPGPGGARILQWVLKYTQREVGVH